MNRNYTPNPLLSRTNLWLIYGQTATMNLKAFNHHTEVEEKLRNFWI